MSPERVSVGEVEGVRIRISWTRAEIQAMKEAVELTPHFEGRLEVRDTLRAALRPGRAPRTVTLDLPLAERFAGRLVSPDLPTALAKVKLLNAIRNAPAAPTETDTRAA